CLTLHAQADPFLFRVNTDDLDFDFLADLQQVFRMGHMCPGQFGQVNQTFCATDVDKCTEIHQTDHSSGTHFAYFKPVNQRLFTGLAAFAVGGTFRQDQTVTAAVDFHHFDGNGFVDH